MTFGTWVLCLVLLPILLAVTPVAIMDWRATKRERAMRKETQRQIAEWKALTRSLQGVRR